ncbi:MAG: hypothetical protein ACXVGE_16250 [Blastococcus sp.]
MEVLLQFVGVVVLTMVVGIVRAVRARHRRAAIQTGGIATCRAVLSVGESRFHTGALLLSGNRAVWRSRRGDETVEVTGGRVLTAREARQRKARPDDVLLNLTLPGQVPARMLINEHDAPTLVDVLGNSEPPAPGAAPLSAGPPKRSRWAVVCLALAGLWVATWVALVADGETVSATVTGGDGQGYCDVTWSDGGARHAGQVDCNDEPAGTPRTVWVLGWPATGEPVDPGWTVGNVLGLGALVALPGAFSILRGRRRAGITVPDPGPEVPRVRVPDQDAPALSPDDVHPIAGETPADLLRRLAPYAARQIPADGWEHPGLPAGAEPPQTVARVLRALATPAMILVPVLVLAWLSAATWYELATTTTTTAAGTSTGDTSESHWPLPDSVTVRFQTSDRVEEFADVATLRSLPEGAPVTVEYSIVDPGTARLVGPADGLGRGVILPLAAAALLLVWSGRRARTAAAGVRAARAAAESPPNPALGLLTADRRGAPLLLACSPLVTPLQFLAVPLQTPLPHGVAAAFAANPGLGVRVRGRLAEHETVLAEVGGAALRPAGPARRPDDDELVALLDSVGALTRSVDGDDSGT